MTNPDDVNQQYAAFLPVWKLCRDVNAGERAVKAAGSTYLPRLGGQITDEDADYKAYKARARFFNALGRTVETMAGNVYRKQPKISLPTAMEPFDMDIDMAGLSLEGLSRQAIDEVLIVGRCGLLCDHPPAAVNPTGGALTVDASRRLGMRPYLKMYKAETILNWTYGRLNNATVLMRVALQETYLNDSGEEKIQIRELLLTDRYRQIVWRRNNDGAWEMAEALEPTMNGKPIMEIPFYFVAPKEGNADVQKPKLEDLAYACIGFYQNSADYENALHVAGTPTPWINGIDDPEKFPEIHLGSNTFLKLPPDSQAGFLQTGADGMNALKEALQGKRSEMAAQGARLLEADKAQAESGSSLAIRRGGENSVLATMAGSVEMSFLKALQFFAQWVGANPEDVVFEMNKDYLPLPMDAALLQAWLQQYLSGAISFETYYEGLIAGELLDEGSTVEKELERLENNPVNLGLEGRGNDDQ